MQRSNVDDKAYMKFTCQSNLGVRGDVICLDQSNGCVNHCIKLKKKD